MFDLRNKTAVITGGSRGIGRACAEKLAGAGANVALVYAASKEPAESLCERLAGSSGIKARAYACNVGNFEESKAVCAQIAEDFGGVDILVNNAGITRDNLIMRMSEKDFDEVIAVNLKGVFNFIKHLSRPLLKSGAGRIINISSVSGLMGNAGQANYAAAKAGVIGLTKTVAREFSSRNVTVNAVAPGLIQTDMTASLPGSVLELMHEAIPLKRMGEAAEVADLVLFLASPLASYITGEVIRVDGGMCI